MKPIVIAGNGPSLAEINYRRLPKSFDTFRVNQFFFEEKYYLGRDVTYYLGSADYIDILFYSLYTAVLNGEYCLGACYSGLYADDPRMARHPNFKPGYSVVQENPVFRNFLCYYELYYKKWLNSGTLAIFLAIQQGYKEIYIAGIDLYQNGRHYAFDYSLKPVYQEIIKENPPESVADYHGKGASQAVHSIDMEKNALQLIASLEGVSLYSVCDAGSVNEIIPLAPFLDEHFPGALEKSVHAVKDFILPPYYQEKPCPQKTFSEKSASKVQKLKQLFISKGMADEWEYLRKNRLPRTVYDIFKPLWIMLKFCFKGKKV